MKEILRQLKEIEESFVGTTQAMGQLPNPVAGQDPSAHLEKDKKKKDEDEEKIKEDIDINLGKTLDIVSLDDMKSIDTLNPHVIEIKPIETEHHVMDMHPSEDGKEKEMPASREEEKQQPPDMKEKERTILPDK